MSDRKFYVYVLLDPRKPGNYTFGGISFSFEPFYVGKGCGQRMRSHYYDNAHTRKAYRVGAIRRANLHPLPIRIVAELTEPEAISQERALIWLIGRLDDERGPLTNHTDGGDGGLSGYRHTEETRTKMRGPKPASQLEAMRLARARNPDRMTPEVREKIRTKLVGRSIPEDVKAKMRGRTAWNKGKPASPAERERLRAMAIAREAKAAEQRKLLPPPPPKSDRRHRKWSEAERAERSGWHHSEESRLRIGDAQRGKPRSQEVKDKIRATKAARRLALYGTRA